MKRLRFKKNESGRYLSKEFTMNKALCLAEINPHTGEWKILENDLPLQQGTIVVGPDTKISVSDLTKHVKHVLLSEGVAFEPENKKPRRKKE